MTLEAVETIRKSLLSGQAIPYLGPGVLALAGEACPLPSSPEVLVGRLTAKASVPHKIRKNLTAAAQFIENFKHRKTVKAAMTEAFATPVQSTPLHRYLASLTGLPLIVHAWYDDLPQRALARAKGWGMVQGVSQAEHFGARTPPKPRLGRRSFISRSARYRLRRISLFQIPTLWRF
jgi:hypothetical protein